MAKNIHCPFCGYDSLHTKAVIDPVHSQYVKVECQNCYSTGKPALRHSSRSETQLNKYDIQRAYTNWNIRSDALEDADFDTDYDGGYSENDWGDR